MGHGAWGMGHRAWGMGHGALIVNTPTLPLCPSPTPSLPVSPTQHSALRTQHLKSYFGSKRPTVRFSGRKVVWATR
ncbi:hypothetical protein H6F73_03830 [Microcoleus sp. FACHB-68]|nr:hypothetical protein [Microcoleus sp. FACHB-68]